MSYYIGSLKEMPENLIAEVESFLTQHKDVVVLGTKSEDSIHLTMMGFLSNVSLSSLYMQTNRQSEKVKNMLGNNNVEIAITNETGGIILSCQAEIVEDQKMKEKKWENWMENYHPAGCTSPDYVLLHFIPNSIKLILIQC